MLTINQLTDYAETARDTRAARRGVITLLMTCTALLSGCEKYALDRQMEELCKKDGGVTIFETVKLAPSEFSKDGVPLAKYWFDPTLIGTTSRLGPDYRYVSEETAIKSGDPVRGEGRLLRFSIEIYRAIDNRLLAISISYGRSGGDFIPIGHCSSASCPSATPDLIQAVFKRGG